MTQDITDLTIPEYFDWRGLHIRQSDNVHKIGTDAILLASWIPTIIPSASLILDIGTGTGILALAMAKYYPLSHIRAIDIDKEAIALAKMNVRYAALENRVEVYEEDVLKAPSSNDRFDLLVSNPPYHPGHIIPKDENKQRAKHLGMPVADWMKGLTDRAGTNGHLALIVPSVSAGTWIAAANEFGFHCLKRLDVFSFAADTDPKRSLLHLTGMLDKPNISKVIIYNEDKTYTSAYHQLTGIHSSTV